MFVPYSSFSLDDSFLAEYKHRQPRWGALGYLVYKRTYALTKDDGSTEEFWETCKRVVEGVYQIQKGHCLQHNLPWSDEKAQRSAQEMYARMFQFKWLPPGRGLSKMGTPVLQRIGGACLNNCGFVSTKDIANPNIDNAFSSPFVWLMTMSMVGVGVGFDTRGAGEVKIVGSSLGQVEEHTVQDSREGWGDYLQQLLESFVDPTVPFPVADYSQVRLKGAPIKGFGGTASGPEALQLMTQRLVELRDRYVDCYIDSRFIVDVANSIGECVVSGGVRRTAEIGFSDPQDEEFIQLKDFENNEEAQHWPRWASNNSVFASENTSFELPAKYTALNGEPGYLFLDNARKYGRMKDAPNDKDHRVMGANPCNEQSLENYELCCLVETFPSRCDDYNDYERTLKFAYLYAKTVTLVPTQSPETNAVMLRNRRIGCSQSGIQDNIAKIGMRRHLNWCDGGYEYIQKLDQIYSDWLCIPRSRKTTSVKPSGTVSKLPAVREGIHESKGEYEFQTIRIHDNSPILKRLKEANYRIEDDIKAPNTKVVYFPMYYPKVRDRSPTMWEQLEMAALMQYYWADNQVSVTIDFDPDSEGPEIPLALEMYAHRLKGLSFLPRQHVYQQAPKIVVTKEEHDAYKAQLKPLNLENLSTHEVEDKFCDGGVCEVNLKTEEEAEAAE